MVLIASAGIYLAYGAINDDNLRGLKAFGSIIMFTWLSAIIINMYTTKKR